MILVAQRDDTGEQRESGRATEKEGKENKQREQGEGIRKVQGVGG